jgi:hypothetical protein
MTMKALIPTLAAVSLALAASFAVAQGTPGSGPGMGYGPGMGSQNMGRGGGYGPAMGDQARRGEMHEQMRGAYEACKDKANRRACMTEQYCAKSPDPAKCQAQAKERTKFAHQRLEQRQMMHEACNGKRAEDLTKCLQDQRQAQRNQRLDERQKAHEACNGKRGEDLGKCLGEQREKSGPHGPRMRG